MAALSLVMCILRRLGVEVAGDGDSASFAGAGAGVESLTGAGVDWTADL